MSDDVTIPRYEALRMARLFRAAGEYSFADLLDPPSSLRDEVITTIERDRYDDRMGTDSLTDIVIAVALKRIESLPKVSIKLYNDDTQSDDLVAHVSLDSIRALFGGNR